MRRHCNHSRNRRAFVPGFRKRSDGEGVTVVFNCYDFVSLYTNADAAAGFGAGGAFKSMRRGIWILLLLLATMFPVAASEIVAPEVPDNVQSLFPDEQDQFGEALILILKEAFRQTQPQVAQIVKTSAKILGIAILLSMLRSFSGRSVGVVELVGVLTISMVLISNSNSMIQIGTETIWQISEYGKMLLPVMVAALTTQGGTVTAATLYGATAIFDTVINSLIASILVPMLYIFLAFAIINAITADAMLAKLGDLVKKIASWLLKILLYVFVGYVSVSGIISGTADQTAIKATKLTISGMIPVVGGILSDASETLLVSAGVIKNSVGIYGLLSIISIVILPFFKIGLHYLMLKVTSGFTEIFVSKPISKLLEDFTGVLGLILGMTGAVCLIQMISIVCFLKGMT